MTETKKRIRQKKQSEAEKEITPPRISNEVMVLVAIVDDFRDRLDKSKMYERCEKLLTAFVAAKEKRIHELQEQVKRLHQRTEWADKKRRAAERERLSQLGEMKEANNVETK